jgi:pimeloyl-ACP methyl ester carboxylesterase
MGTRQHARGARVAAVLAAALAWGCTDGSDAQTTVIRTTAIFSPSTGDIPLPNDLLFSGSTDGTLAVPLPANPAEQGPVLALNALDGWSTNAPMRVAFSQPLDPASIVAGTSVRLFEVALVPTPALVRGAPVQSIVRELVPSEFEAGLAPESTSNLAIAPRVPFENGTSYMVLLTDDLVGADGFPVMRSIVYQLAAQETTLAPGDPLLPLQQVVLGMHGAAESFGVDPDTIVLGFAFTTQSVAAPIAALKQIAIGDEQALIDALCVDVPELLCTVTTPDPLSEPTLSIDPVSLGSTGTVIGSPFDTADVYVGGLTLPYYLEDAADGGAPTALSNDPTPLSTFFRARYQLGAGDSERHVTRFNPLPQVREQETVPVLLSVPKGPVPPGGWPTVIYQHGVYVDRSTLFALADVFAISGFAVIGIDLPLHGVEAGDILFTSYEDGGVRERTFGLDVIDNTTLAAGPDGLVDPTGQHFVNLASLRSSRDLIRQAAADLFALTATLDTLDYDGVPGPDLDVDELYFLGHSLGGIVGSVYLSQSPEIVAAVLANPGSGVVQVLAQSPNYGDDIAAGLAGAGLVPGTPEYEAFLFVAQTVLDGGDPASFAGALATADKPTLLFEVVGETGVSLPDQTIPNTVANAPLAGTEPLIAALGLSSISDDLVDATGIRGAVRFVRGDHTSMLLPLTSAATTFEMQNQSIEFFLSAGQMVTVINDFVVQ